MILWRLHGGKEYTALPETARFDLRGTGYLTSKYKPNASLPDPPSVQPGCTFKSIIGESAIYQYVPNTGIGYRFGIDYENWTYRYYYVGGAYGVYKMNEDQYSGTYSITIIRYAENNEYNSAVANYFHWTKNSTIEYGITVGLPLNISLNVSSSEQESFEKGPDHPAAFQFYS